MLQTMVALRAASQLNRLLLNCVNDDDSLDGRNGDTGQQKEEQHDHAQGRHLQ